MREDLFRSISSPFQEIDNIINAYDKTIDTYLDYDVYYTLFPILSTKEVQYDNPFFLSNNITLSREDLSSDEYKTISYLAIWEKEKIKYNPKRIINYARMLGYTIDSKDVFTIVLDDKYSSLTKKQCDNFAISIEIGDSDENGMAFEDYLEYLQRFEDYDRIATRVGVNCPIIQRITNSIFSKATIAPADGFDYYKLEGNFK